MPAPDRFLLRDRGRDRTGVSTGTGIDVDTLTGTGTGFRPDNGFAGHCPRQCRLSTRPGRVAQW